MKFCIHSLTFGKRVVVNDPIHVVQFRMIPLLQVFQDHVID